MKKGNNKSYKDLTWEELRKSIEEDKHLTEEEQEKKYRGLNLSWD